MLTVSQGDVRAAGGNHSVNSWRSMAAGSEFVAEADASGIDGGLDRGSEAHVFPLRAQEQARHQHDVGADAEGIAVHHAAVLGVGGADVERNVLEADGSGGVELGPVDMGGRDDISLSEGDA